MKARTTKVAAMSAIALTATTLAGCSSPPGGTVQLEIESYYAAGSALFEALENLTAEYTAENPDVTFTIVPSGSDFESRMITRLASGDVPDLWNTHGWSRDRYADFLVPLSDQSWNDDVVENLDAAMRDEGEIYSLPLDLSVAGIMYNADVLAGLGIDPASLTTWDAFNDALAVIAESGVIPISVSGKTLDAQAAIIDWMAPGKYNDEELEALSDGEWQDAPYATMLEQIQEWSEAGFFNPDSSSAELTDVSKALGSGTTAFVFTGTSAAPDALAAYPDAKLGYLPIPSDLGDPYLIGGEDNSFGVSNTSEHQEEALDFLSFLSEPESVAVMNKAAGSVPGLTTVTTDVGALQSSYDAWVATGAAEIEPFFDRVYLPSGMWSSMASTADSLITGQGDVEGALAQLKSQFDTLYEQASAN